MKEQHMSRESEALRVYNLFWDSYIRGDVDTFSDTLDDTFEMIGTSATEICHTKADGIEFLKVQIAEIVGKVEMRNRQIDVVPIENLMLVNELCDIYVLVGSDWNFYSKIRISTLLRETEVGWKVIQQHGSLPDMRVQEGETLAIEKISKENLELRDAVKRRTVELEQKNRELQIEAALERVRAKALAMHKSEDFLATALEIFQVLNDLGINPLRSGLSVMNEQSQEVEAWSVTKGANNIAIPLHARFSADVHPVSAEIFRHWKMQDPHWKIELTGDALRSFVEGMPRDYVPMDESTGKLPSHIPHIVFHYFSFSKGVVFAGTDHHFDTEETGIMQKFTGVFAFAYTRFLDLQKAETQAREAQIQLALERIRARTMAMHSSEELEAVASVVFDQLTELGIPHLASGFVIFDKHKPHGSMWMSYQGGSFPKPFEVDFAASPVLMRVYNAWNAGQAYYINNIEGEQFVQHVQLLKKQFGKTIDEAMERTRQKMLSEGKPLPDKMVMQHTFFKNGSLVLHNFTSIEEQEILNRFANVFDQTYTRFLDLQNAEAQVREAKIEASLEKVRSRTMAMHRGDELADTAMLLFEQLVSLGFKPRACGFLIMDEESQTMEDWGANLDEHGKGSLITGTLAFDQHPILSQVVETWRRGDPYFIGGIEDPEELKSYYEEVTSRESATENIIEKVLAAATSEWTNSFNFEYGMMYVLTPDPITDEEIKIMMRFAGVFKGTYTRFLDLQKAEAQAREAQIEAALERVRSRTMGMQRSDELQDAALLLFQQIQELGIPPFACGFNIWDNERKSATAWMGSVKGLQPPFKTDSSRDVYLPIYEAAQKGEPLFVIEQSGKDLEEHYEYLASIPTFRDVILPDFQKKGVSIPTFQIMHCAFFSQGYLMFITYEQVTEAHDIFKRFAKVFEQTYTRFLDLKKVEAQVRKAKIEASLERTRTQSMLMQHSKELDDTLRVFHEQVLLLGINSAFSFLWLPDEKNDRHIFWAAWGENENGSTVFKSKAINYPLDRNEPATAQCLVDWKGTEPIVSYHVASAGVENYFAAWQELIDGVEKLKPEYFSGGLHYVEAFMKYGCFGVMVVNNLTEDEKKILGRFAIEFERTYTRFLDLQKAEAQAREAQIEAALERVRSRTMGMQKSEDLSTVASVMFEQMKNLGGDLFAFGIVLCDKHKDRVEQWHNLGNEGMISPFSVPVDLDYIHRYRYDQWKAGKELFSIEIPKDYIAHHFELMFELPSVKAAMDEVTDQGIDIQIPDWEIDYGASFSHGYLLVSSLKPFNEDHIFPRFAKVFDQAYTRFLDLQKAEAQAREAKIEAALEKVRSRTMGMQSSEELPEVANILFLEVQALGIPAWSCGYNILSDDGRSSTCIMSSEGTLQKPFALPLTGEASFLEWHRFIQSEETFFTQELGGRALAEHYDFMKSLPHLAPVFKELEEAGLSLPTYQVNHLSKFTQGFLLFITYENVPDAHDIFKRFTKVFEQTYTRFLDLQKAEAQAREAQIQLALERVRARSMAMHHSDELAEVVKLLYQEFDKLKISNESTDIEIGLIDEETGIASIWAHFYLSDGTISTFKFPLTHFEEVRDEFNKWKTTPLDKRNELFFTTEFSRERWDKFVEMASQLPGLSEIFRPLLEAKLSKWVTHNAYFSHGILTLQGAEAYSPETQEIQKRFAKVFEQTYTRFLDLQKAEVQARETRIEAALEKVRARALAMQMPDELKEVAQLLREEMGALGVEELETSSIYIHDEGSGTTQCWFTIKNAEDPGRAVTDQMTIDLQDTWVGRKMYEFYHAPEKQTSILMQGENRIEWIRYCEEKSALFSTSGFYGETIPERTYHLYKFSNGFVGAASPGDISPESWDLLKRATNVFSFAYTRFHDLQIAEASAWSSLRQASLDRVRADIASMRSTQDLQRITPLIWQELTNLQVSFIRCGVFIMDEEAQIVHTYLSTADGKDIAAIHLPYNGMSITEQAIAHWRKQAVYIDHWDKAAFHQWTKQLIDQGHIASTENYQAGSAPDHLHLHFVPFTQGMLYVGSINPLPEESIDLIQSLARAFATAYARYEDFNRLEAAKKKTDLALADLESAKDQLVQQEKLASLGQLTAGIAHEIKNPLNFVNNFSEVSMELLDEMLEELEMGNTKSVKSISEDIKANLDKIHDHGSRADSIVKSMLMHSRGGSGQKEPTDLNAMIREYVNLTFHGMRAGKQPINVQIDLQLDETTGAVPVIVEDISRVIVNLCNNAFDAMRSKLSDPSHKSSYTPKLTVHTKQNANHAFIEIVDNGPGIPEDIKDKILQPFFTTKKGTQGTGLGLSITNDIVKAHGGELKVESEEGKGSVFIIQLPIHS